MSAETLNDEGEVQDGLYLDLDLDLGLELVDESGANNRPIENQPVVENQSVTKIQHRGKGKFAGKFAGKGNKRGHDSDDSDDSDDSGNEAAVVRGLCQAARKLMAKPNVASVAASVKFCGRGSVGSMMFTDYPMERLYALVTCAWSIFYNVYMRAALDFDVVRGLDAILRMDIQRADVFGCAPVAEVTLFTIVYTCAAALRCEGFLWGANLRRCLETAVRDVARHAKSCKALMRKEGHAEAVDRKASASAAMKAATKASNTHKRTCEPDSDISWHQLALIFYNSCFNVDKVKGEPSGYGDHRAVAVRINKFRESLRDRSNYATFEGHVLKKQAGDTTTTLVLRDGDDNNIFKHGWARYFLPTLNTPWIVDGRSGADRHKNVYAVEDPARVQARLRNAELDVAANAAADDADAAAEDADADAVSVGRPLKKMKKTVRFAESDSESDSG